MTNFTLVGTSWVFVLFRHDVEVWATHDACWEGTLHHIGSIRTGKTISQAAPIIIEAPGPVIATSHKCDLSNLAHILRAKDGDV